MNRLLHVGFSYFVVTARRRVCFSFALRMRGCILSEWVISYRRSVVHSCHSANVSDIGGTRTAFCTPVSLPMCQIFAVHTHSLVHPCQSANVSDIAPTHTVLCTPVSLPMCQILAVHTRTQSCASCQSANWSDSYWRDTTALYTLVSLLMDQEVSGGTYSLLNPC